MSHNLRAEVSKLRDRQAELAARGTEIKKKNNKRQKTSDDAVRKASPANRKRDAAKMERETTSAKLFPTRGQRAAEGFAAKSRKYKDNINKRLKDVIDCLLESRQAMTKAEICTNKHIDAEDAELWEAVLHNERIEVLKGVERFRYLPRHHHIVDKEQLLMHIRRHPQGTPWNGISDTYKGVELDLEALVAEKKVFVIENPDIEDRVVFWNDPTQAPSVPSRPIECVHGFSVEGVALSDQMLELWREAQPPTDNQEYEQLLQKSGIPLASRKGTRRREAQQKTRKERKPKDFRFRKITNVHMPELFKSHQPDQID